METEKFSKEHMKNIVNVERLRSLIVNNKTNDDEKVFHEIYDLITNVHVRDGLLNQFSSLDFEGRRTLLDEVTEYTTTCINSVENLVELGDLTAINGAFLYLHMGLNIKQGTDLVDHGKTLDGLFNSATELGSTLSLLQLMMMAREHSIPDTVFTDSILSLTFEKCTAPADEAELFNDKGE